MDLISIITFFIRMIILVIGSAITYRTFQIASLDDDNRSPFLFLGVGFALLTLAMVIEGFLDFFEIIPDTIHFVETILAILAFFGIVFAIRLIQPKE